MSRRSGPKEHIIRSTDTAPDYRGEVSKRWTAWCGEKSFTDYGMTTLAWGPNACPACSSRYYAAQIKAAGDGFGYRLGANIAGFDNADDLRALGFSGYGWKSIYPVERISDGAWVAFIACETGWGEQFKTYALAAPVTIGDVRDGREPTLRRESEPANYRPYRDRPEDSASDRAMKFRAWKWSSKERALWEIPGMVADGLATPGPELIVKARQEAAELRQRQEARAAADAAQAEERRREMAALADAKARDMAHIREAFRELIHGEVTNYQREGLFLAAARLGLDTGELQTPPEQEAV